MTTSTTISTTTASVTDLVSANSILYVRPILLTLTVNGCRPNTPMNVFFDSVYMNSYATPIGASYAINNTELISDSNGNLFFELSIPGGTFNTGSIPIVVTDAANLGQLTEVGSTFGSATCNFTSAGIQDIFQTTTTTTVQATTTDTEYIQPVPTSVPSVSSSSNGVAAGLGAIAALAFLDPIAQSFVTYGATGGVYLTSIDLFFNSKDQYLPVRVELRQMVNGYPDSNSTNNKDLIVYCNASDVNISNDASVATTFSFPYPIYLPQDQEYCIVVHSNSNNYNLFTAKIGEKSIETGNTIFSQPYVGVLFESTNNATWTAFQDEELKFNIKAAQFNTSTNGVVNFSAEASYFGVPGVSLTTTAASATITYAQSQKHGLSVNDRIYVQADTNATYNGIAGTALSGSRSVTSIIDEYTLQYTADANALATGTITTGGQVKWINVTNGGSGYTTAPTVTLSSNSGTGASATAVVNNGAVVAIQLTAAGGNYTSAPTVTISGGNGTGASAVALIDATFSILTNKPTNFIVSNIPTTTVTGTSINATVSTTQLNYPGGALSTYVPAETIPMNTTGKTFLNINAVVASSENENVKMSGNKSMILSYELSTNNPNVSPLIDTRHNPCVTSYNYRINDQIGENVNGSDPSGANTELSATDGTAQARYITKTQSITTPSTGILVLSDIYSQSASSVEWYIRTVLSSSQTDITAQAWQPLTSPVSVNQSTQVGQYMQYQFYLYDIPTFDTYQLKAVLRTSNPAIVPIVNNYSVIVST